MGNIEPATEQGLYLRVMVTPLAWQTPTCQTQRPSSSGQLAAQWDDYCTHGSKHYSTTHTSTTGAVGGCRTESKDLM
jgi:hypothetical protein